MSTPKTRCADDFSFELSKTLQHVQWLLPPRPLIAILAVSQVFTSDHALKMDWLPKWIAIIGSGYIGLEFSDVYTALGSEVTFVEVGSLVPASRVCAHARVCNSMFQMAKELNC